MPQHGANREKLLNCHLLEKQRRERMKGREERKQKKKTATTIAKQQTESPCDLCTTLPISISRNHINEVQAHNHAHFVSKKNPSLTLTITDEKKAKDDQKRLL